VTDDSTPFYATCAHFYDGDYEAAGYDHDIDFYVEAARRAGGPVLELGCGTGRILLPTARAGVPIVGVDSSSAMLDRLAGHLETEPAEVRDRIRTALADVRTLDLGERFSLVTAPFRVMQHLVERADQRAFLAAVSRHLAPDGEFVFDCFQPDFEAIASPPHMSVDIERTDLESGRLIRRVARAEHTPEDQTFTVHLEWMLGETDAPNFEERSTETELRWYTLGELELLLELAGFEIVEAFGHFDGTPFGPGASDQIVRARRRC
jgi:SAM-dependent methyltransferase